MMISRQKISNHPADYEMRSRDRRGWRQARRVFSLVLALSMLLNTASFAVDNTATATIVMPEGVVGSTYVDSRVDEQETNLHDDEIDDANAGESYAYDFQTGNPVLLSQIFALYMLPPERIMDVDTVLFPGGDELVDPAELISIDPIMDEEQNIIDYRLTALQNFETVQLLVYLIDDVYTLDLTNLSVEQGEVDLFDDDDDDASAFFVEGEEPEPYAVETEDENAEPFIIEPEDDISAFEETIPEKPIEEAPAEVVEAPEIPEEAEIQDVDLPQETVATDESAASAVQELPGGDDAEPEAPRSLETEYLTITAAEGEALPGMASVGVEAPDYMQVVEAWTFDGEEGFGGVGVTLDRMPELAEGEYLAIYSLIDGALADAPVVSAIHPDEGCTVLSDGFALVRLGLTGYAQLPTQSVGRTLVAVGGVLPVDGSAVVEPNIDVEYSDDLLAVFDIRVQDALGNDFQPLADAPAEITVRNEAIRAAIEGGSELYVSRYADGLELDGAEILSAEGDAVTFAAEAFETYTVRAAALPQDDPVCGDYAAWTLDDAGTLNIYYTGADMETEPGVITSCPWNAEGFRDAIQAVVMQDGIASIADGVKPFVLCGNIASIRFPATLTSAPADLLEGCTGLRTLDFSGTAISAFHPEWLNDSAIEVLNLSNCPNLTQVDLSRLDDRDDAAPVALYLSATLTSVTLPSDTDRLGVIHFDGRMSQARALGLPLEKVEALESIRIRIAAKSAEKVYDGAPLTVSAEDFTVEVDAEGGELPDGYELTFAVDGSQTQAGTSEAVASDARVIFTGSEQGDVDVTEDYRFEYVPGALTVTPKAVTVTTGSAEREFDGTALTNAEADITGLVDGETATVTATGSRIEVGSSENAYSIDWGETNKDNYVIEENLGTLSVIENTSGITLTAVSDGGKYAVAVNCGADTGIDRRALLNVAELSGDAKDAFIRRVEQVPGAEFEIYAVALDMAFVRDDAPVQPENAVKVSVELSDVPADMATARVFRFTDGSEEPEELACALDGRTAAFETGELSTFVLCGYRPDFQWGEYTWNVAGAGETTLGGLLEKLGVAEIALSDVIGVSFSNPEYMAIEPAEDDWRLKPLAPFDAAEALTLTLANGQNVAVDVVNPYPAQRFTGSVSGVSVTVEAPAGAFPEGVAMKVKRIWNSNTLSDIREAVTEDFVQVRRVQAVDIAFYDADGAEIEPRLPISVVMSVLGMDPEQSAIVVHVDDAGAMDIQDAEVKDPQADTMALSFDSERFSLYAVVVTETISTHYIDASGRTWNVEVSYGPEAGIPSGAALEVSELTGDAAEAYAARAAEALNVNGSQMAYAKALDIAIIADGERVQPEIPVSVSIKLLDAPEADENTNIEVIHFGDAPEQLSCALDAGTVAFEADGFSVYVVAYTVDFHWGDYTYSIAGESEIALSDLLEKLGVTEIALNDIEEVTFSNPELVGVEKLDGDWLLRSLAPFHTEEALVLALKNGESVEIRVTDEQVNGGNWSNGTNGNGTWEIDEDGVLTLSGTGKMADYDSAAVTPWNQYRKATEPFIRKLVISGEITYIAKNLLARSTYLSEIDASQCASLSGTQGADLFKATSGGGESAITSLITTVDFSGNTGLTGFGQNALRDVNNIQYLDISSTQLPNEALSNNTVGFGASKKKIQTLKANNCSKLSETLSLSDYSALATLELSGCTGLTSLTVPSNVTTLDVSGCTGLTGLTVPSKVTSLNVSGCTGLTSLSVPGGVTTLNVSGCTGLTSLSVPGGVTTLNVSGCTGLTSLSVPGGVTTLNVSGCTGLTSLDVSACTGLTTLDVSGTGLTSLNVPSGVTTLNASGCTGLTVLDLSETSLTNIDVSDNASLTALKLPATVTALNITDCPNLVIYFDGKAEDLPTGIPDGAAVVSWGDYTYTIRKNTTATLDEIFTALGITAISVSDVQSIATDSSVLAVTDLTVECLDAFTETQTLTVTLTNGITGTIKVDFQAVEEKDNLNLFLDSGTVYSYGDEAETNALSIPAIRKEGDTLNLTLSFSEIPEGEEGERQMTLLGTMAYTFPAGLAVTNIPETVTLNIISGGESYTFPANVSIDEITGALTVRGNYGDQASVVSASTMASFTVPVTVQPATIPGEYDLGNGMTLSTVKPRNVKVSSFTAGNYDAETGTATYTVVVEAESNLDTDEQDYPVTIKDSTNGDVSGSYTYTQGNRPADKPATQVDGQEVQPGVETSFTGFPLTVAHMYDGDTITLTYTAKPQHGSYDRETQRVSLENTVTIDNNGNPSNDPEDDTASVAAGSISYAPLTREYVSLDGSWAYWRVTVNPDGYALNGGKAVTLADTFHDEAAGDAKQSIDYSSVAITGSGDVTYDYSGNTGTFVIPDSTPVTITYRTRITAQPGEAKTFRGTAVLKTAKYGDEIARSTAGVITEPVVIYPSASDVAGTGNYMVKLFVYAEGMMQQGIEGATFILLDANQRALEYKVGDNKDQPVTFTTGSNGYVNIELNEEPGDVSIEKNTAYYLEMMQAVPGYQKDNTLYSFMITDDPDYNSGGFYTYYNGDTMKVRLYAPTPGLSVSIRFSGSYALRKDQQDAVTAVLQKLDEHDHWVEVERHPYTDTQWGAIVFKTPLYDSTLGLYQNQFRVVVDKASPWDLPENIHLVTTYYSMVNTDGSNPETTPQVFEVESASDTVNVVIDNRYEEPQLTIIKMDKSNGEVLPGAEFSVYTIVNGAEVGDPVTTLTTDDNGELVIRGGEIYSSETLYGIKETAAPAGYLLPQQPEWHYFYFCNDEYLEPSILANLPADATAINLTSNGDRITIGNQKTLITIPVMKLWQGNVWPEGAQVVVGLYRSVEGSDEKEPVCYSDGSPRTATLNSDMPYNNTAFKDMPSRDDQDHNYVYSIKEESVNGKAPLEAGYNQEYGISSAGVYIVRNKPATTLTVSKAWYDFQDNKVEDDRLAAQSPVTFDVYRSTAKFADGNPDDGITNADMTTFVSGLVKVRENMSFGAEDDWAESIPDLDKQDDLGNRYYYYALEMVPSFGNELYEADEDAGTILIKNRIAPKTVNLTVTKAALVKDPRPESLDRDFEFTLKLQADDTHPIRSWQVYADAEHPENDLVTDWDGKAVFTLKPTDPDHQPTEGASIILTLPVGVTAAVTETYNAEYTVATSASVEGTKDDNDRTFTYVVNDAAATLTYTNTLHVVCKVVDDDGNQTPFESLKSALKHIHNHPDAFTAPWTIYMLEDYTIPPTDGITLLEGESLTLTTASTTDELFPFNGGKETDRAVITRGGAGDSMLKNAGTLTLANIVLDGGKDNCTATGDGGLVYSTGTLNLSDRTTLRNSAAEGKGGAVYAEGTVNIVDGVEITGNSAPSASALYLSGTLNMSGGSITENTGASDGAVVAISTGDQINLSGSPVIFGNTNKSGKDGKAANLYIGADSDNVVNVVAPGLAEDAKIGVTAMEGHMAIGEQFASAEFEQTEHLNCFVNDTYGYRGKLKDGTSTNIVWNGLTLKIKKVVESVGANADDRFTITLSSMSIVMSTYIIDGTIDYTVTAARTNRPGRIVFRNVKADDEITISPLPVGDYTIAEADSNYAPAYTIVETGSGEDPTEIENGVFHAENSSSVTVTNTRRLADVKLTKTLDDQLKTAEETQEFSFTVKLTDADETAVSGFTLAEGVTTNADGVVSFTMSPSNAAAAIRLFKVPVGATMTITETIDPNYEIIDADEDDDNIYEFQVTDDGADVTFANVRKMAKIKLRKNLTGKVSAPESFTYTVALTRADRTPAANFTMYRDEAHPENNITTDGEGIATITLDLQADETTKTILLTIPEGTKLVVTETEVKRTIDAEEKAIYTTKYSVNGAAEKTGLTATINKVSDSDHSIVFNNTRKTNTIVVKNTVNGYSGNVVPFTYTATVTDWDGEGAKPEGYDDYDLNDFTDGTMTFKLTTGQTKTLTVPYGATLTVAEGFIVGYGTTVKRGGATAVEALSDTFIVTANMPGNSPLLFTNSQLIGLRIVNNTSSTLENVTITVDKNNIYLVNEDQTGQERISTNKTATISVGSGKTAILEIQHDTSATAEQNYTVSGSTPVEGYYYTINNEPSFHETANPAILRVYDAANYEVKGKLRYSVQDSTVTFTEQPLVSFDANGGAWTTEMDGYHDRDGDRKVYQKAVNSGETVACPTPDPIYPTAENIPFLGWTEDEEFAKKGHEAGEDISAKAYDFDTPVTEPVKLYAVWAKPARDYRVVTVKNGNNESLNVTVTLTQNNAAVAEYAVADGLTTDADGKASFTLTAGESKNLTVPDGVKLVFGLDKESLAVSSEYTLTASADNKSHTIESVERDGTVTFIPGICKITDSADNVLYDANGNPAVYGTLSAAFTAYAGTLYTDASHTTAATQAAVKMLVDEYTIQQSAALTFPNKTMTLTTAGKEDTHFPYMGTRDRSTIYRASNGVENSCFILNSAANTPGTVTLTNIILDGGSERGIKVNDGKNGALINVTGAGATLNITTGATLRNVEYKAYTSNANGGAIYLTDGTLNVNAGQFSNLHAYQGGAICVTGGTLNLTGTAGSTQFEDCSSERQDGGAIYHNRAKDLVIDGGENKDNPGIIFTRCVAAYTNGTGDGGDGGAIFATSNYTNTVTVKGCSFIECSARTGNGSSTAGYGGGGICAYHVKGLTVEACTFDTCDTLCGGGAVAAMVRYTDTVANETVTIKNCSFNKCNCKGQAGAVGVYQDNNKASNSATKLSVIGSTFVNCSSGTNNGSGGAVQCYLPCMVFTNSNFTDCWAGKEGGAVNNFYGDNYTQEWSKSSLTLTNCRFIRCRAEDRYDTSALQHYGGGINTKVKTVTVTDSYFEDCVSTLKEGGALHIGGQGGGSTASITGSTFKNCSAKNGGGAVLSSHETLTIENCYFYGCSTSASNGGAVYHYQNSRGASTQKNLTIRNSTFGVAPNVENGEGCSAASNGGAIWARATTSITLEGLTINNCSAKNGGGIYLTDTAAAAKIIGGAITNSTAESGSAVYVEKTATFSGELSVSGNTVSTLNSGAIQTVDAGTLNFEGNVKVENNTCSVDSVNKHDVLMQIDGNTIINTTSVGLGSGAHIGVYVSDSKNAYANHGKHDQPFGTYNNTNAGSSFLDAFFNDRDSVLYGYQGVNDHYIYWGFYVCKITDAAGNTLKLPNGRDAVYQRLSQAIAGFNNVTGGTPVYIKMLVEDYPIRQTDAISGFPAANITLTTASKDDAEHPYRGTAGTLSTIYRTNSDEPLFNLSTTGATFQLKDITLDGRKDRTTAEGDYKLITASTGEIVVNSGTTLQYAKGDSGAAITGATVTINGGYDAEKKEPTVKIANCTATGNGGAISAQNLTITNAQPNDQGKYGTVFSNCASANGGAIYVAGGTVDMTGASFTDCHSSGEGGVLFHDGDSAVTTAIANCAFSNDDSESGAGGAVSSKAGTLTVEGSRFDAVKASGNGGAINHTGTIAATITATTFNTCQTTGNGFGGSVYTQAETVDIVGSSFKDSTTANHGGALYCASNGEDSAATISGTSFVNCATTLESGAIPLEKGCGGAIYSRTKTLTLQSHTPEGGKTVNTTINGCSAPGSSGAVHMETSGSALNIVDSTVISGCYADMGGAIYLKPGVTMNIQDSPEFSENGFKTIGRIIIDATEGACIYLAEGGRINLSDSPKFNRNILPNKPRVTNRGITDFARQDIYLAGYKSDIPFDINAASIYVVGELTGDYIWVWPEQAPNIKPNEQFAKIGDGVKVSSDSLSKLLNALGDEITNCSNGEYLAGVQVGTDAENIYWDKMYIIDFKKKDNKGVAVPDAGFTLYKDLACTDQVATAESADGEFDVDAQGKYLQRGMVEFSSIRIGAYYMKETVVPLSFKENNATYLVLVGTPYLSPNDGNRYLWEGDGPLNVADAATLVARYTTDAGKFFGIFPLDENNKAVLRANLASNNVGIENIRNDYQVAFMKEDGNGKALPGAAFTIYTQMLDSEGQPATFDDGYPQLMRWSRDGETYPDPIVSADGSAAYKDKDGKTLPKGMVYFRELPLGTYYLLETAYPGRNGDGRRTYYLESDRVFRLEVTEDPKNSSVAVPTLSEWEGMDADGNVIYTPLPKDGDYYVVSNQEVVCKLTDADDVLLYTQGHQIWENKDEEESFRLFPAIYPKLEKGFADAQTGTFVYASGNDANVDAIKLKVLKDFNLAEPIIYNSERAITFTTAEAKSSESKDRYIFSTTRTTDTSRALISRNYDADISDNANDGALITLEDGAVMTLQNIRLNGQKSRFNGRAIRVKDGSTLNIYRSTKIENFRQEAKANSAGNSDLKGGAILLDNGTSLFIDGGYNRTAEFSGNTVVNARTEGKTAADGGAIAVGANCTFSITNAQFNNNSATATAKNKGNGGAVSINETMDAENMMALPMTNVVFSGNTASYQGGALRTAEKVILYVDNCTFRRNTAQTGDGGAIAALSKQGNETRLTINGGTFTGNKANAGKGGAVKIGGCGTLILDNSPTMSSNSAKNGGAITVAPGATATVNNGSFTQNTATADGGVFYVEGEEATDPNDTALTPEEAKVHLTVVDGSFTGNKANQGGAIYAAENAVIAIALGEISNNEATSKGGAIHAAENAAVSLTGGEISGNKARLGSALWVENNAEATITHAVYTDDEGKTTTTNVVITDNKVSDNRNGGAINVGGTGSRLYFGGSPTVFDNFSTTDAAQQKNLILSADDNAIINTLADGLQGGVIGVYVTEAAGAGGTVFEKHGLPGKDFGTFGDEATRLNPQVFRSDHSLALYGVRNEDDPNDKLIYWVDVICKLTDDNDKILYQDITININGKAQTRKAQAVYTRITRASVAAPDSTGFDPTLNGFTQAQGTLYSRSGNTYSAYLDLATARSVVKLKMLRDYDLDKGIVHEGDKRGVVFTTAEQYAELTAAMKANGDFFAFGTERTDESGNAETRALIKRGQAANVSMIASEGKNLELKDIVLDSEGEEKKITKNGGIVEVKENGALTIASGATLQNAVATGNGGAVYVNTGATVKMTGGAITGNAAVSDATLADPATTGNGGAIYVNEDATAELTGGEISGNSAATSGGAVYAVEGAIITMKNGEGATTGVTINGNTAKTAGAGIFLAQGSTLNLEGNPSFGGTGRDGEGADADIITEKTEDDKTVILGNFLEGTLEDMNNGQKPYAKFRQDIYAAGYMGLVDTDPKPATSIVLTGNITSDAGAIWVAMEKPTSEPKEENNHYEMLKQFAVVKKGTTVNEKTMQAFRNAWDDESTGCGADYLTGQDGDALKDETGMTWNCVYWTGGFDFVFRKIDGYGEPLPDATFKLYTSVKHEGKLVPARKDAKDTPAENLEDSVLGDGDSDWKAYEQWNAYQQPDKETKEKGDAKGTSKLIESVTVKAYKEDGKPVDSVVTGEGLVEFDKIPPGNYFMVETTEPENWERMVDVYRVYVDGTGWVSISAVDTDADGKLLWPEATDPTAPATEPTVTFVKDGATDKYILPEETPAEGADTMKIFNILNVSSLSRKVILKKVDIADNKPLPDAKFTVYCYDGSTVMQVKTTDDSGKPTFETLKDLESGAAGAFWIGWLPYGIYYMQETAPEGYKQPAERIRLKVDADGVTILDEEIAPSEPGDGGE